MFKLIEIECPTCPVPSNLWIINAEGYCLLCDTFFDISDTNKPVESGGYKIMMSESFLTDTDIERAKEMFKHSERFAYSRGGGFVS